MAKALEKFWKTVEEMVSWHQRSDQIDYERNQTHYDSDGQRTQKTENNNWIKE